MTFLLAGANVKSQGKPSDQEEASLGSCRSTVIPGYSAEHAPAGAPVTGGV